MREKRRALSSMMGGERIGKCHYRLTTLLITFHWLSFSHFYPFTFPPIFGIYTQYTAKHTYEQNKQKYYCPLTNTKQGIGDGEFLSLGVNTEYD